MTGLHESLTRRWLAQLARPERLADPEMRALLRAHGRPAPASPLEAGRAAAELLEDAIASLDPGEGAAPAARLPHRVLTTCFVEGTKNARAAAVLGLSERQLSRERGRAIALLTAQLLPPEAPAPALPPGPPEPFLARPHVAGALADALRTERRACVCGPAGAGKTALVAAFAAPWGDRCFWYRTTPRTRAGLAPVLFDLGHHLAAEDPSLAAYVRASLPRPDPALGARIALAALGGRERLLVFDGELDPALDAFLDEVAARPRGAAVVTIARTRGAGEAVAVPPLRVDETRALLALHGIRGDDAVAAELRRWTRGNARLTTLVARWMARTTPHGPLLEVLRDDALLLARLSRRRPTGGRSALSRRRCSTACR